MNTENNKLIAEFMGHKIVGSYLQKYVDSNTETKKYWSNRPKTFEYQIYGWQITHHESKIFYHSVLKWLMEVVEKIESLGFEVTILKNECTIRDNGLNDFDFDRTYCVPTKIEAIYNACVDFIKWYNEQNQ